jgi:hypothetical protein
MNVKKILLLTLVAVGFGSHGVAMADNALTQEQLVKSTQLSLQDLTANDSSMAAEISGFRVSTVGSNAQVIIDMNADGMQMSTKYVCIPQDQTMICDLQQ